MRWLLMGRTMCFIEGIGEEHWTMVVYGEGNWEGTLDDGTAR